MTSREPVMPGDELPDGDYLTWTCGECGLCTQGGRRGLMLHMRVVHPHAKRAGGPA